jgi:molecular chaperone GrpE
MAGGEGSGSELAAAKAEASERLEALMRLKAEYENYRKRVDRDRDLVRENAVAAVLRELLSLLDDIGRARDHGDLTGGFRSVADALEAVTQKFGLIRYGEVGDEFDPTVHEALMHEYSDDVTVPTCTQVLMPGYRHGEKVLRAARVAVADPTEALPESDPAAAETDAVPDNPPQNGSAPHDGQQPGSEPPRS